MGSISASVVVFVGYFATVQVYVLQAELVLAAISLVLLSGQLLFGIIAGFSFLAMRRDRALLFLSAVITLACLTMVLTMVFLDVDYSVLREVCITAVILALIGWVLAGLSFFSFLVGGEVSDD